MNAIVVTHLTEVESPIRKTAFFSVVAVVFSIPWENMIVLTEIGTISRILGLLSGIIAVFAVLVERKARPFIFFHGILFFFLFWSALSFFWSTDTEAALTYLISLAQIFIFVWLLWEFAVTDEKQALLLKSYVLGAYVSALFTFKEYLTGQETAYLRYAASGFDPNDLGLILALGVPMAWHSAISCKNRFQSFFFGLYIPVAAGAIALTSSRGSVIALLVASLFILWTVSYLSFRYKCAMALLAPAAGAGMLFFVPKSSWERIASTPSEITSGTMNARLTIWDYGRKIFADNPLLGVGPGNFNDSMEIYMGSRISPHNTLLAVLVEQGIVGFLIVALIFFSSFYFTRRMPALDRRMWIILLLTWAAGAMSLTWTLRKPTWFLFGLLACCGSAHLCARRRRREQPEENS